MKFMHLSDLHIGKRVNEFSMLEDQRYILDQILALTDKEKVDGVWIAGDIYDKAVPSAEAVQLFDDFLTELVRRRLQCFLISGNHDSAERIAFGSRLMDRSGVYLSPVFDGTVRVVELEDDYGPLRIYLLPFLKPAHVRQAYPETWVESYQEAMELVLGRICGQEWAEKGDPRETETQSDGRQEPAGKMPSWNPDCRNVLLAHQFLTGAARCESEEVSVGGLDQISAKLFEAFDYVALGHLHTPQTVGSEHIRYCGTPLKYSFSEARDEKSVTIVEFKAKGELTWHTIPLKPRRDVREIRGTYMELTALETYRGTAVEDYLHITLTDEEDVPDALGKLRSIYPNIMKLDYDNLRTRSSQSMTAWEELERKNPLELFEEMYRLQNNREMSGEQRKFAEEMIEKIWNENGKEGE